jgi:Uma2 family endonuclease
MRVASLAAPMSFVEAPIHRLSVEDVRRMSEVGVLREDDRVELVDGVLVDVSPPGPSHSSIVAWLTRHLVAGAGEREVRVQDVIFVEGGFFMPDLMVIDPLPRGRQPSTAELIVEVSVTTQRHDAAKALRYAEAGVTEYWVVDEPARRVDVSRRPGPTGYAEKAQYRDGEQVVAACVAVPVGVSALLG